VIPPEPVPPAPLIGKSNNMTVLATITFTFTSHPPCAFFYVHRQLHVLSPQARLCPSAHLRHRACAFRPSTPYTFSPNFTSKSLFRLKLTGPGSTSSRRWSRFVGVHTRLCAVQPKLRHPALPPDTKMDKEGDLLCIRVPPKGMGPNAFGPWNWVTEFHRKSCLYHLTTEHSLLFGC